MIPSKTTMHQCIYIMMNALCVEHGRKLIFGSNAYISKTCVCIPRIPMTLSEETVDMFMRWVHHECGCHGRYADFDWLMQPDIQEAFKASPTLLSVWMSCQDNCDEQLYLHAFPGYSGDFNRGLKALIEDGQAKSPDTPANALSLFCRTWGSLKLLGHDSAQPLLDASKAVLVDVVGEQTVSELEALLLERTPLCKHASENFSLANDILALVKLAEHQNEQPDDSKPQKGDDKGQSNDNNDSSDSNDDEDSDSEQGDPNDSSDDTGDSSDDDENSNGDSDSNDDEDSDSEQGAPNDSSDDTGDSSDDDAKPNAKSVFDDPDCPKEVLDFEGALNEAIDAEVERAQANGEPLMHDMSDVQPTIADQDREQYNKALNSASCAVSSLKTRLVNILKGANKVTTTPAPAGKRLMSNQLHRVRLGDNRIFAEKRVRNVPTKAVSILLDLSGSMTWEESNGADVLCQQAAVALAEVCHALKVEFEIIGFGGFNAHPSQLVQIKSFNENFNQAKAKIGGYLANQGGGTPLGEGMLEAFMSLSKRNTDGHVMFAITDGEADDVGYAVSVADMIMQCGVDLYGIGIGTESVKEIFLAEKVSVVRDVNELGNVMLSNFSQAYAC